MKSPILRERGFTIIELLIVVAIIGIVAAISVPNLINALHRSRQKRTMAEMRSLSQGVEMYEQDHSFYPKFTDNAFGDLGPVMGAYIKPFRAHDAWKGQYWFSASGDAYTLTSFGSDRTRDASTAYGPTRNFQSDIIFSSGVFIQWPEGRQRQ